MFLVPNKGNLPVCIFLTFPRGMLGLVVSTDQPAGRTVSVANAAVVLLGSAAQLMITADNLRRNATGGY